METFLEIGCDSEAFSDSMDFMFSVWELRKQPEQAASGGRCTGHCGLEQNILSNFKFQVGLRRFQEISSIF